MESSKQAHFGEYANEVIRHKARRLIGKYGLTHDDYEDLKQELSLDVLLRLSKFDPDKASLHTFIARIVDRKVSKILRHRAQEKRDYRREGGSLDEPIEDGDSDTRGESISQDDHDLQMGKHDRSEIDRSDMRLDVRRALSELPPELKDLAEGLLSLSITEAARELGVPRTTLYTSGIARLRRIFEDKGLRDYL